MIDSVHSHSCIQMHKLTQSNKLTTAYICTYTQADTVIVETLLDSTSGKNFLDMLTFTNQNMFAY